MNIFQIVGNLYTQRDSKWMEELEDSEIQPFVIQRFLVMNDRVREYVRWLDKYVYHLPPKMYLSLAWSILPKEKKAPYVKYIKKEKESVDEFFFILQKVKKHLQMSDNDFAINKERIVQTIKSDMPKWFRYYGIAKKYWKDYMLDYDYMKKNIPKEKPEAQKGIWEFK